MHFHRSGEYCKSLCIVIRSLVAVNRTVVVREAEERSTKNEWGWEVEVQAKHFVVVCVELANRHTDLLSSRGVDTERPPFSSATYGSGIGRDWRMGLACID